MTSCLFRFRLPFLISSLPVFLQTLHFSKYRFTKGIGHYSLLINSFALEYEPTRNSCKLHGLCGHVHDVDTISCLLVLKSSYSWTHGMFHPYTLIILSRSIMPVTCTQGTYKKRPTGSNMYACISNTSHAAANHSAWHKSPSYMNSYSTQLATGSATLITILTNMSHKVNAKTFKARDTKILT